jgi:hypothetical protein
MSNSSSSVQVPYLRTSRVFPQDSSELENTLSKMYIEVAQAVNKRTIGIFNTFQAVTGNQYYSLSNNNIHNPIQYRQSYRQIYPFGAISGGAMLSFSHGISGLIQLVASYGNCITEAIVNANGKYLPIPYVSVTDAAHQIELYINDSEIFISNGASADNILSGTIVLEYLLN